MLTQKLEKMVKFSYSRLDMNINSHFFLDSKNMLIGKRNSQNHSLKIINLFTFNKSIQIFR